MSGSPESQAAGFPLPPARLAWPLLLGATAAIQLSTLVGGPLDWFALWLLWPILIAAVVLWLLRRKTSRAARFGRRGFVVGTCGTIWTPHVLALLAALELGPPLDPLVFAVVPALAFLAGIAFALVGALTGWALGRGGAEPAAAG